MILKAQIDTEQLKAARQKYLQLGREIEKMPFPTLRSDLGHTHSKLGIFFESALGTLWRSFDQEFTDES